jgi:hypothetical protein
MPFTADAIEAAEIRDDGSALEIIPTPWDARTHAIPESDVQKALARVGWKRFVRTAETPNEVSNVAESGRAAAEEAPAKARTMDSANCIRCGGKVLLFSDGTSQECGCLRRCVG